MIEKLRALIDRVAALLTETDTTLAEFWGSTLLLSVGAWLIVPFQPDTFDATRVYRLLSDVMPEWAWGMSAITIGCLQAGGNLARNQRARRQAAFLAAIFFGFIAFLAVLALPASVVVPMASTAALLEGIVYLHLRPRESGSRARA